MITIIKSYLLRVFCGSLSCFVGWGTVAAKEDLRPNLLFIMTDQQRFDAMSCAGNPVLETPNMDRIAREGARFTNAYVANPVCVPSRVAFLTGRSPVNMRVEANAAYTSDEVPDVPTFDSLLVERGYRAEYYGKWHSPYQFAACYDNAVKVVGNIEGAPGQIKAYQDFLVSKGVMPKEPVVGQLFSSRNQRPYEPIELDENQSVSAESLTEKMDLKAAQSTQYGRVDLPPRVSYAAFTGEETLEALDRLKDGPFTLTCSFDPPHPPMIVQEPYYSLYPPERIPVPASIGDPMTDSPYRRRSQQEDQVRYKDEKRIQQMRSVYYGMVKEVDDWIGEILQKLDDLGLSKNTLVVFTSDHGEMLGDHGLHSKMIFYEGSVHVPLLVRFPGRIAAGTVVDEPVSSLDVFPTILDYLDIAGPAGDGISLRPFMEGNAVPHDVVSYSTGRDTPNYMIRSGHLKLMMGRDEKSQSVDALYDLAADPLELRNLVRSPIAGQQNREQAEEMKSKLVAWLRDHEPHRAAGVAQRKLYGPRGPKQDEPSGH